MLELCAKHKVLEEVNRSGSTWEENKQVSIQDGILFQTQVHPVSILFGDVY